MRVDVERYRAAEHSYWRSEGVEPTEQWLELAHSRARVRVQVVGDGPPVLFLHGGSTCGTNWAPLVARLTDRRCLLLDRPGCGLSDAPALRPDDVGAFATYAENLAADVFDALDVACAPIVATSLGGYFALRGAATHPERVTDLVELGFPVGAPMGDIPFVMRMASMPRLGRLMTRVPVSKRMARSMLRQIGLKQAMDSGRLTREGNEWFRAVLNHTDTMRNEIDGAPPALRALRGRNETLLLPDDLLARVRAPVYFLWGSEDPFGGEETARRFVVKIPDAQLEMMPDAGHAVWVDDPDHAAATIRRFLTAGHGT
jgi:pimeloyl-ACP methyl ester carboxylesterase